MDQILHNMSREINALQNLAGTRASLICPVPVNSCNRDNTPLEGTHSQLLHESRASENAVLQKWQLCAGAKRDLY